MESMDTETNSHFGESAMMLWRRRDRDDSRKAHGDTLWLWKHIDCHSGGWRGQSPRGGGSELMERSLGLVSDGG